MIQGQGRINLRPLVNSDFDSYEALALATGVDFSKSDARVSEQYRAINAKES
jgi:hypothetical protein